MKSYWTSGVMVEVTPKPGELIYYLASEADAEIESLSDALADANGDAIELTRALRWILENQAIWSYGDFAYRRGTGELEGVKSPDDVYELVSSLMERETK